MRVLVTGGLGFVGRHFVRRLVDDGHDITVVDNLSSGLPPEQWMYKPKNGSYTFKLIQADLRDWTHYSANDEFDLVIHCAAVVGGRLKIEGDPIAVATDLAIDANFFQWVVRGKRIQKVVYFSSSAVYPVELQQEFCRAALAESLVDLGRNRIGMPDATYGWAKLTGELLAKHAVMRYNKDIITYRPFSGYGEDQDLAYPFPSIIQRVIRREDPIVVWGSGAQQRDFIHIDDVVEGVLSTMDRLPPGDVLNLGSGKGIAFIDLAMKVAFGAGYNPSITNDPTNPEGVFFRVADTYKLDQFYKPKVSLDHGIRRALDKALVPA